MNLKNISFYMFGIGLFVLILYSMGAYFLWNAAPQYLGFSTSIIGLWYIALHKKQCKMKLWHFIAVFFLLFSIYWNTTGDGFNYYAGIFFTTIPASFLLLVLSNEERYRFLSFFTLLLAWTLGVSLIGFILLFFIPLPSFGTISNSDVWDAYEYTNYLIVIKGAFYDFRFNSIFREPGHVAMIASFFLYANHYDFSKLRNKIILVAALFTLSLAGYVLIVVGYTLHFLTFNFNKEKIKKIIVWPILLFGIWIGAVTYNGGDNVLNRLIIERLMYDPTTGSIQGDNRVSEKTDETFEFAVHNGNIVNGLNERTRDLLKATGQIEGAGYKIYLLDKGIIGTISVFLFYFILMFKSSNKLYAVGMLLLYILAFLQRAYPAWAGWLIPFICGVSNLSLKHK